MRFARPYHVRRPYIAQFACARRASRIAERDDLSQTTGRAARVYRITWNKSSATIFAPGIFRSGMGRAWNSLRQGIASHRAQALARLRRALSVAIPVLAYI